MCHVNITEEFETLWEEEFFMQRLCGHCTKVRSPSKARWSLKELTVRSRILLERRIHLLDDIVDMFLGPGGVGDMVRLLSLLHKDAVDVVWQC
jgi:hypothetical protein